MGGVTKGCRKRGFHRKRRTGNRQFDFVNNKNEPFGMFLTENTKNFRTIHSNFVLFKATREAGIKWGSSEILTVPSMGEKEQRQTCRGIAHPHSPLQPSCHVWKQPRTFVFRVQLLCSPQNAESTLSGLICSRNRESDWKGVVGSREETPSTKRVHVSIRCSLTSLLYTHVRSSHCEGLRIQGRSWASKQSLCGRVLTHEGSAGLRAGDPGPSEFCCCLLPESDVSGVSGSRATKEQRAVVIFTQQGSNIWKARMLKWWAMLSIPTCSRSRLKGHSLCVGI